MTKTIRLKIPEPHSKAQAEILNWRGHGVALCGRRFGKTEVAVAKLILGAINNPGLYMWIGLSWRSASMKRAWRLLKAYTRDIWRQVGEDPRKHIREADKEIDLPGEGTVWLRTAEAPESIAGEAVKGAVMDEFTLMGPEVWPEYLQPCLLDYGGWLLAVGVPKGKSWASNLFEMAKTRKGWHAWQCSTYDNPYINKAAIDEIKAITPELLFRQEYMAEVIDESGCVFRHVGACISATVAQERAINGHTYVAGVDWGRTNDATVFAVLDVGERAICYLDRFQDVDYVAQAARLKGLVDRFGPAKIIAEANAMGLPVIERLQRDGLPVVAWTATNETKAVVVEGLQLAFEQESIRILANETLISELQAFEATKLPSGRVRYAAPTSGGYHDDTIIATALAWHAGCGKKQYAPPAIVKYV